MTTDASYTINDHLFRTIDPYAGGKYLVTTRWIGGHQDGERTLYHIGCGGGAYNATAVDLGFRVDAFEPDPAAAALAAQNCPPNCQIHVLALEQITGENAADVVVMHDVLEHIADDVAAVNHLQRLMKPSGQLVLSVPALPRLFGLHDEQLGHYRRYTKRSLRKVLETHFEIRKIRYYGFAFLPVSLIQSRWLRRPYPTDFSPGGLMAGALRIVCRVEARLPLPIGTSLLVEATPRGNR